MQRIPSISIDKADPSVQPILNGATQMLGFTPKLLALMANSANVLSGWFGLQGTLAKSFDSKTRDAIALATTEVNQCKYCLAAHTFNGTNLSKLTPEEIMLNRQGKSADPKRGAAALFAKNVTEKRGKVSDADLAAVRAAGYTDKEIVEIIALVAQFSMTNYFNNAADTEVDFPVAQNEYA